jgi:hypothetical protein
MPTSMPQTESTVRVAPPPEDPEDLEASVDLRIGTSQVLYRLESRIDDTIDMLARALLRSRQARREAQATAAILDGLSLDEGY